MIGVTILGGYLGAGKTTLVNQMLRQADGKRLAVLVNEFGALPIDEDLIEAEGDTLISIAGGCICCSYGNDMIQAMVDLQKLDPEPDHVVLETSGVAIPGAIAATLSLLDGFALDGIVVLADAETIQRQASDAYMGDTVRQQLADAHLLVLTKTDLVGETELSATSDWLRSTAPHAAVILTSYGQVPNAVIMQGFDGRADGIRSAGPHQTVDFKSAILEIGVVSDAEAVARALADPALSLVRAKGFVATPAGLRTIQVVGRRWSVADAPADAAPGLVVIGPTDTFDHVTIKRAAIAGLRS